MDSAIGYAIGGIDALNSSDSLIGFAVGVIDQPALLGDSAIGFQVGMIEAPTETGIRIWDGSSLHMGDAHWWDGSGLV